MALETEKFRRYLLSGETEAERRDLIMSNSEHDFERDISIAENELIEDYLEGALSDDEKDLFESNFLSSVEHRDLVSEVSMLKKYSSGPAKAYLTGEYRPPNEGLAQYRPLAAAAAIVVLGVLGLLSWRMFQPDVRPPLEQQYVDLNAGDLGDLSLYPSVVLAKDSDIRPAHEARFKTAGPGTSIMFRMPVSGSAAGLFDASATMNGKEAFKIERLKIYRDGDTSEVRLLLPREILEPGHASITLTPHGGGEATIYPFIAE